MSHLVLSNRSPNLVSITGAANKAALQIREVLNKWARRSWTRSTGSATTMSKATAWRKPAADGDEDVEGHRMGKPAAGDEDVEGHRMGKPSARERAGRRRGCRRSPHGQAVRQWRRRDEPRWAHGQACGRRRRGRRGPPHGQAVSERRRRDEPRWAHGQDVSVRPAVRPTTMTSRATGWASRPPVATTRWVRRAARASRDAVPE